MIVTNNGKLTVIGFEEAVQAARQAKVMVAFNKVRLAVAENGFMTEEEISFVREKRKKK